MNANRQVNHRLNELRLIAKRLPAIENIPASPSLLFVLSVCFCLFGCVSASEESGRQSDWQRNWRDHHLDYRPPPPDRAIGIFDQPTNERDSYGTLK